MTIYQLKVFVATARLGSFTQAAIALKIRQPSVSLIIQSLQRELEIKLFERLGNKIRLTMAGEELLREAELIVARAQKIKQKIEESKGLKKGKLTVGGSFTAGASFLPLAIQKFKENCPGIQVALEIARSSALEKKLLDGGLDIAILTSPPCSSTLIAEAARCEEIVPIAAPNHPLARKRSVPLELLSREPLIVPQIGAWLRDTVEKRLAEKRLPFAVGLEIDIQSGNRDSIKNAVASNLGIGFSFLCHIIWDVKAGRLKILNVPELELKRALHITIHKGRQYSSQIQAFVDVLRSYKNGPNLEDSTFWRQKANKNLKTRASIGNVLHI